MKLRKGLPIVAMLLIALVSGCSKELDKNSSLNASSADLALKAGKIKPGSGALKVVNLGAAGDFVILSK